VSAAWVYENGKDECVEQLEGNERLFLLGSEIGMMRGYVFHGRTFGGDGVNEQGRIGAGCCCAQDPVVERCARVGRADEGCSSGRPEDGELLLALLATRVENNLLYLGSNEPVLTTSTSWWKKVVKRLKRITECGHTGRNHTEIAIKD
jgi:hypothetical protein